ncbi:CHAD domain-containing protein [Virgisporangium aliadipatigenens]|uniref:CHAD domain-containing protein n=1 Tax=Virgisporangium aliadipatigenens TaxID=741659 RepID=A0A8J3YFM3_9ACTN|nr:CYTH and CHAD domain-containing protein [Virgisporangium aliadipatigenens]GIJ43383.1 CHAD domain-containing protein [Virgisporangium aliadipatigenens]
MGTSTEIERKYEVPNGFQLPDLAGVASVTGVGDPAEHSLDATYFDTPGLTLAKNRMTLRRRTGGHDAGWHLKRPAGADRSETRVPLGKNPKSPPGAVVKQIRDLVGGDVLAPVARIRTRRVERPLRAADGAVLALVADDVVTSETPGDVALVQRWREIEVELVDGPRTLLDAVDRALRAAGARPARDVSKLARALGDRLPKREKEPTAKPEQRPLPDTPLARYLDAQRAAIAQHEPGVRAGDPESVHKMRVATRRLRSTLKTFKLKAELDAELKWLADRLGAVRDGDVLTERLHAAIDALPPENVVGPVKARIRGTLAAQTAKGREELNAALDSDRFRRLVAAVTALPHANGTGDPRTRVRKAVRRADRRLDAARRARRDRDERLHDARKAYKRARYAVEVLEPAAGKPASRLVERLTELQDTLGAHQDSIVAGKLLRQHGMRAHAAGENAFTYGILLAEQRHAGERSLAEVPRVSRRAGSAKVRKWLTR